MQFSLEGGGVGVSDEGDRDNIAGKGRSGNSEFFFCFSCYCNTATHASAHASFIAMHQSPHHASPCPLVVPCSPLRGATATPKASALQLPDTCEVLFVFLYAPECHQSPGGSPQTQGQDPRSSSVRSQYLSPIIAPCTVVWILSSLPIFALVLYLRFPSLNFI